MGSHWPAPAYVGKTAMLLVVVSYDQVVIHTVQYVVLL